jgi:RimJ/RimL family protein N-acetyltransferase
VFTPIRTERLLIRPFRSEDVAGLVRRRNDPEVARFQDWELPFTEERAAQIVSELVEMDGPVNGEWWMAIVEDGTTGEVLGDLAVHLSENGRIAEVGYTFHSEHWGKGYAMEALTALVDHLFVELDVTRAFGMLHPDNPASAMVLERCGFLFEGHTKLSYWLGEENSDDLIYGLTRSDWEQWRDRPLHPPQLVELVEVTHDNQDTVLRLKTHKSQERFVAPMVWSFADAYMPEIVDGAPAVPWMKAVAADGEIVGFIMIAVTTEHHPEPFLWRLLIDRLHQRRGIASKALDLLEDELLAMGDRAMLTSWVEGKGSPEPFYLARGFERTGRIIDGEIEGRKRLT